MGFTDDENPIGDRLGSEPLEVAAVAARARGVDLDTTVPDEHRRTEELERALQESQRDARKMDELVSIVSHDLRSPLSSIQLNIQSLLHSRRPLPQWVRTRLIRTEELVRHMAQLINDVLLVERNAHHRTPISPTDIDLLAFVRHTVSLLHEQIEAAKISVCIRCDEPVVGRWDRVCLSQIVSNLVTNAIKYGAGKPFEIALGRYDGCARIAISDHGIGLDEADHERIFERFAQVGPADGHDGVGLGLWIVAEATQRLNGRVRIRSTPGEGSTFIVDLPCH